MHTKNKQDGAALNFRVEKSYFRHVYEGIIDSENSQGT